jgi:plasmid maintenance system antidote protein VapI
MPRPIDPRLMTNVSTLVRDIVDRQFDGNQHAAARAIRITQAQVSNLYNNKAGLGVGLRTLLALRDFTGKSLDELLGLAAPQTVDAEAMYTLMKQMLDARNRERHALLDMKPPRPIAPPPMAPKTTKRAKRKRAISAP